MAFRKPQFVVEVDGVDYTSRFAPVVKSITVADRAGTSSDSASIVLADIDGSIKLPGSGARMKIYLGDGTAGVGLAFSGFLDEVRSSGSKSAGRALALRATGIDPNNDVRSAQGMHMDDASFADAAKKFGKAAGVDSVVIAPELGEISRPYWSMQFESFLHWGQRTAREVGATFKMQDGKGMFVVANGGKTAGGQPLPTVTGAWGDNLLSWDMSPIVSKPRVGTVRSRYYDPAKARWRNFDVETDGLGRKSVHTDRHASSSEQHAEHRARSLKGRAERNSGEGSVAIVGNTDAKPEGPFVLQGAREGVDGNYRIDSINHRLTPAGFITSLELKQPTGEAGKDERKPTRAGGQAAISSTGRVAGPV